MYRQHEHQSTSAECGCKKGAENSENNQFIGVSHGGKTTKIHAVVDALGNPVHFLLTGGNIFDASVAVDLLSEVKISGSNILGDKAYGTKSILHLGAGSIVYDPTQKECDRALVLRFPHL